jgi:hypothetical protein
MEQESKNRGWKECKKEKTKSRHFVLDPTERQENNNSQRKVERERSGGICKWPGLSLLVKANTRRRSSLGDTTKINRTGSHVNNLILHPSSPFPWPPDPRYSLLATEYFDVLPAAQVNCFFSSPSTLKKRVGVHFDAWFSTHPPLIVSMEGSSKVYHRADHSW